MKKANFYTRQLVLLTGMLFGSLLVNAQKNYAIGVVDSKNGQPIAGASIKILSNGIVTNTSESGNVVMLISPDDSLLITANGYKDRRLQMAGQFIAISVILDAVPATEKIAVKTKKKKLLKKSQ